MKKIICLLLITTATWALSNFSAFAQCEDDSEEEVPIQYVENEGQNGARSFFVSPISVTISPGLSKLNVSFLYNVGIVSVKITNHLTGDTSLFDIDSKIERTSISVSDDKGYYTIVFKTEDGASYRGHFAL